jgi:hypothetical protein
MVPQQCPAQIGIQPVAGPAQVPYGRNCLLCAREEGVGEARWMARPKVCWVQRRGAAFLVNLLDRYMRGEYE